MEHESEQSGGESDETCDVKMECPVCFSQFSPTDCRLKLLMCTHEICVGCVKKMDRCPICKEELSVVDLENAEFVARCGFSCSTCGTRRTSDKMRICITCSETNGFLVETTKLKECSEYIFCSECIIEDHIEQRHRQEKLMNYDVNYTAIKDMRRTCLIMKPILERVANGIEERAVKYKKLMKAMSLVLSPDTDLHVLQLHPACAVIRKCLETVKEDSEIQRKYTSIWNELYACLDEEIAQNLESEHEDRKKSLEEIIRLQQEEAEKLQSDTIANKEMIEKLAKENEGLTTRTKNLEEKIRTQEEENVQLRSEALKQRETVEKTKKEISHMSTQKNDFEQKIRSQQEEMKKIRSNVVTFAQSLNDPPCLVRTPYKSSMCTMTPSSIHRLYFSVNKPMFLCKVGVHSSSEKTDAKIVPGCRYLIDLKVDKQVNVYSGQGGQRRYELPDHPGYTMDFSNCEGSETSIECGQFRGFYFVPSP